MTFRSLAFASFLAIAPLAHAVVISVSTVQWEISKVYTSFDESPGLLMAQTWWGDSGRAQSFALELGGLLDDPNGGHRPMFAYSGDTRFTYAWYSQTPSILAPIVEIYPGNWERNYYAVATRIHDVVPSSVPDSGSTLYFIGIALMTMPFAARRYGTIKGTR